MSIAMLMNDVASLKAQLAQAMDLIGQASVQIAKQSERLLEYEKERREHRKELRELKEQFATFAALKEAIAKDAREILGQTRDRIDPTKVKMPHPLKALGYKVAI